ncbi:MAG: ABC-F family ATP-binding cassette domain-containing protein [Anaerolineae bacterium]|nr:ABC-F family ATP-binding cassette domain-containing protein [Anaerolineae bacterium]
MSLLTVTSLSKSFGDFDLFSGISFSVAKGARMALVGPNGVGKTTLLRILVGEDEASSGTVASAKKLRIGYLPQEADFDMKGTLWESCESIFDHFKSKQAELHRLEALMAESTQMDDVMDRYGKLQHDFEEQGGYSYPTRIRQVLGGLGFDRDDFNLGIKHLSGGQRTRAFLARLLLSDPDLLLLDEPTNHLDISAVEWLEGYLAGWDGAAVIVSHDRYFLDKACNAVLEMLAGGYELYRGNYSAYFHQRRERSERRQEVFEREKDKLLKEALYVKKYIAGQNVAQARGRLRRLSRTIQAIEQIGMETVLDKKWIKVSQDISVATSDLSPDEAERRVRALRSPVRMLPKLHLNLRSEKRSGDLVIRTKDIKIGFVDKYLFSAPDIELRRLDCAALIGPNGAGKTTFLKTILGQLKPLGGEVELGASLQIGYFAQAHEGLDPKRTVMEEIDSIMPAWLPGQIRDYLGKYLFSGDDALKKVEMLSGGERGRLALAKLALQDTNLLLLDEPTNHLDIPSQEILQAVLDDYPGTILLVTHDRYLIDALATQIWEVTVLPSEGSKLTVFKGTYSQLIAEREKETTRLASLDGKKALKKGKRPSKSPAAKEERRRKARIQELENQISELDSKLSDLGQQLEIPPENPAEVARLGKEYASMQLEMDEKLGKWEGLQ